MPYKDPERQREYQNNWLRKRWRDWLAANGPCVDCGSWEDLEVDHVNPAIKISHRIWSWARERREAELAKCVARCKPCHKDKSREQTWKRRFCPQEHDTSITGRDSQSRCKQCRLEIEYPRRNAHRRKHSGGFA